jgi:hypothetical protein
MERNQKIKLLVDHNNKKLRNPKYGYIVGINDAEKVPDGVFVETGLVTTGKVYLVQTSWSSGMLWYTENAMKAAGGANHLGEWQERLAKDIAKWKENR